MNTPILGDWPSLEGSTAHPAADNAAQALDGQREQVRQSLEQRFRYHLRTGQLSPLLHLVMKYKLERLP